MSTPNATRDGDSAPISLSSSTNSRPGTSSSDLADHMVRMNLHGESQHETPGATRSRESSFSKAPSPVHARLHVAAALTPPQAGLVTEERAARGRPHSYSGGISLADLRRLATDQQYPADMSDTGSRGGTPLTAKPPVQLSAFPTETQDYSALGASSARNGATFRPGSADPRRLPDDEEIILSKPPMPQPIPAGAQRINQAGPNVHARNMAGNTNLGQPRSFSPALPQHTMGYNGNGPMPINNQGGVPYDMETSYLQQQGFRGVQGHNQHEPSGMVMSDPTLAMLSAGLQGGFMGGPGQMPYSPPPNALNHTMQPPPGMYPNGGLPGSHPGSASAATPYFPQEIYAQAENALTLAQQLQQRYLPSAYNHTMAQPPPAALSQLAAANANLQAAALAAVAAATATATATAAVNAGGPSANNRKLGLYKTELCRSWEEKNTCRYGNKCQFAHGQDELRNVQRHPKYKTEICRTFWVSGSCPYGKRCCFIHTDASAGALLPGPNGSPPPTLSGHVRTRSSTSSTASDTGEGASLLQRISAQRAQNAAAATNQPSPATPREANGSPISPYSNSARPGGLRVDTASLGGAAGHAKENKSAYPSFPQGMNPLLSQAAPEPPSALSPIPATAHPEFGPGRHGLPRPDPAASSGRTLGGGKTTNSNRHSFNGTDLGIDLSALSSIVTPVQPTGNNFARAGHMRSGSAGNWSTVTRPSRLGAATFSPIPSADLQPGSPWGSNEVPVDN